MRERRRGGQPAPGLSVVSADGGAASAAAADLVAQREDEPRVTLNVRSRLDAALEYGPYVSRAGRGFDYASARAVAPGTAALDFRQYPVRGFAVVDVRVPAAGRMSCD